MRHTEVARHALVVGAGLAGAAVCAALARRGWHCTLIDAASGPAQGASALPVGMLSPHVTRAPTPLSRLCALGVASTRAELQRLLVQGHGWQACEVDNLGHDAGRWPAALVRPAALVQAWLAEARERGQLSVRWNAPLQRLRASTQTAASAGETRSRRGLTGPDRPPTHPATDGLAGAIQWQALDAHGQVMAQAPVVVVTAAWGSLALLGASTPDLGPETLPLRPVKGQLSLGALQGPPLAERAQRKNGVFVPLYEDSGLPPEWPARIWAMGSTYQRGDASTTLSLLDHERNAQSLQALHPQAARHLRQSTVDGTLLGWAQVRCASLDRLPLLGALPDVAALQLRMAQAGSRRTRLSLQECPRWPGLYMLGALGSRGLTLAHWCAEQLAAQLQGESANTAELDLLRALDPARFAWRRARRQPACSSDKEPTHPE